MYFNFKIVLVYFLAVIFLSSTDLPNSNFNTEYYGVENILNYKNNPLLQEKIFLMNVMRNKWILRREISRYSNRYLGGVYVSESGIIAAAHLSGPGNVKKYLRSHCDSNLNKKDANGTSISHYMKIFKDYDIEGIPYKRKPQL